MKKKNFKNLCGFTLAEVLITLSILGVVAAITVPSLINKQSEREAITRLKKTYSALTQAYDVAMAEDGTDPSTWYTKYNEPIADKIMQHMNVIKSCKDSDVSCLPNITYKSLTNTSAAFGILDTTIGHRNYVLKDGTLIGFGQHGNSSNDKNCTINHGTSKELQRTCAQISVDINGKKGPNKGGVDFFMFNLTAYGIIPLGSKEDNDKLENLCNKDVNSTWNGPTCTAWVVYKGNMDYLRKDISW